MANTKQQRLPGDDEDTSQYDTGYAANGSMEDPLALDFENIPEPLPAGTYTFHVTQAEAKRSETTQQIQVVIDCEVIEGAYAGQNVREWLSFSEKAIGFTSERIQRMTGRSPKGLKSAYAVADMLRGRVFRAAVEGKEFNGRVNMRFVNILGPGDAGRASVDIG